MSDMTERFPCLNQTTGGLGDDFVACSSDCFDKRKVDIESSTGDNDSDQCERVPYLDFSRDLPDPRVPLRKIGREGVPQTFPMKLYAILSNPEFHDIISWLPHGRAWRILQPKAFEDRALPLYFRHKRYSSFARQVNGWGFRRITHGADYSSYYHELFLKGMPHLSEKMKRPTSKDLRRLHKNDVAIPDFYLLSRENPLPEICDDKGNASSLRLNNTTRNMVSQSQEIPQSNSILSSLYLLQRASSKQQQSVIPTNYLEQGSDLLSVLAMMKSQNSSILPRQTTPSINNGLAARLLDMCEMNSASHPSLHTTMTNGSHRSHPVSSMDLNLYLASLRNPSEVMFTGNSHPAIYSQSQSLPTICHDTKQELDFGTSAVPAKSNSIHQPDSMNMKLLALLMSQGKVPTKQKQNFVATNNSNERRNSGLPSTRRSTMIATDALGEREQAAFNLSLHLQQQQSQRGSNGASLDGLNRTSQQAEKIVNRFASLHQPHPEASNSISTQQKIIECSPLSDSIKSIINGSNALSALTTLSSNSADVLAMLRLQIEHQQNSTTRDEHNSWNTISNNGTCMDSNYGQPKITESHTQGVSQRNKWSNGLSNTYAQSVNPQLNNKANDVEKNGDTSVLPCNINDEQYISKAILKLLGNTVSKQSPGNNMDPIRSHTVQDVSSLLQALIDSRNSKINE